MLGFSFFFLTRFTETFVRFQGFSGIDVTKRKSTAEKSSDERKEEKRKGW